MTNGATYSYVVSAVNSAGASGNSPEDSATPIKPPVNVAVGGTATASEEGTGPGERSITTSDPVVQSRQGIDRLGAIRLRSQRHADDHALLRRERRGRAGTRSEGLGVPGIQRRTNWTTLDTQSGQAFSTRFEMKTYPVARPAAYRYYRLNITANNGAKGLHVAEFGSTPTKALRLRTASRCARQVTRRRPP